MQMQASPSDVIPCHAPATRERLGEIPVDGPDAVRAAVARARAAQQQWCHTSFALRRRVLRHILDEVLARADELCALVVRDSGKTFENAMAGEIWPVCEKLRWTIKNGEKYLRPERMPSDMLVHKTATIEYHPLGVMGAIIPWNYPLQNIMNPAIPALMAGNGIVIKPSEWVAWSSAQFKSIFERALVAEGQSPDLVQLVQGYGPTGKALVEGGVDGLCFIGSATNGRRVIEASATNLIPVVMELGGKDPLIVCDDADLMQAVHAAINGTFINCGQNCVSSERILVFDGIYEAFEREVVAIARGLRQGAPEAGQCVDVGAMITPLQLQVVERLVHRAVEQGARVLCGGEAVLRERGDFFAPTILADCTPEMEIMQEEVFGPVMLLSRVRGEDQAVELANATRFGLSSSVFSKDHGRAKRIADRLAAGSTTINDFGLIYMAQELPFGGVKQSGFGRMNGRDGLRACTNQKGVVADRWPLHFANQLHPVSPKTYSTMRSAIRVIYGDGVLGRARAVAEAVRALVTGSR
jgi:acyl-CoA reductase-like NAD-dependent aldehyde dehydrogenase